jgi:macrolide transport system ATP-binding/permease protein
LTHAYLKAQSLTHHYGGETLFRGVSLVLNPGDRTGLVGPNGVGKTTLLSLLAGRMHPARGQVTRAAGASIGWSGDQPPGPSATVGGHLAAGLGELSLLSARMRELELAMATAGPPELAEYASVQDRWTALGGWSAHSRLAGVRDRLGLAGLPDGAPLSRLSGGELARLALARLLLSEPDVLILDEPTNHLDADGAAWLGGYLTGFTGAVLVASHDRAFLDRAVTRIVELDGIADDLQCYEGGYTAYRAEKARRWQRRLLSYEAQQKYRRRLEDDIAATKGQALSTELSTRNDRLRRYAKKVAKKAKARERRLTRQLTAASWIAEPQTRPPLVLAFPGSLDPPGTGPVLAASGLTVQRSGRRLLNGVGLRLDTADRVLVSGVNGSGKTTLLRALAGQITPDSGTVTADRPPALLPQRHGTLPPATPVIDFFRSQVAVYADDAERLLESHLFGPDQWSAPLGTLSAGEARRLLLAMLVNSGSPVLLLDEPTNYLDFDALDVAEEALRAWRGTLVMVTHDRYFAGRVGFTRHWQVGGGAVTEREVLAGQHSPVAR